MENKIIKLTLDESGNIVYPADSQNYTEVVDNQCLFGNYPPHCLNILDKEKTVENENGDEEVVEYKELALDQEAWEKQQADWDQEEKDFQEYQKMKKEIDKQIVDQFLEKSLLNRRASINSERFIQLRKIFENDFN